MSLPEFKKYTFRVDGERRVAWGYIPDRPSYALVGLHGAGMTGRGFIGGKREFWRTVLSHNVAILGPTALKSAWGKRVWANRPGSVQLQKEREFLHMLRKWLLSPSIGASGVGLFGNSSGGWGTTALRRDDPRLGDLGTFDFYAISAIQLPRGWVSMMKPHPTAILHSRGDNTVKFVSDDPTTRLGFFDTLRAYAEVNGLDPEARRGPAVLRGCGRSEVTLHLVEGEGRPPLLGVVRDPGNHGWMSCERFRSEAVLIEWAYHTGVWQWATADHGAGGINGGR